MIVHAQREVMLVLADDHLRRLREVIVPPTRVAQPLASSSPAKTASP